MLRIQDAVTGLHERGGRPAGKGLWTMLWVWIASLTIALLAGCGGGGGDSSSTSVEVPEAPSAMTVTAGDNEATIEWNAVARATSYNIYRSTTQGLQGTKVGASATTSYVDSTALNGTTYYYQLTADNAAGEGPPSAQSAGATPSMPVAVPQAPTGLNATPGDAQVTLSWTAAAGARSYNIYRSTNAGLPGSKIGSSSTTEYIDAAVVNGTAYFYQVTADNAAGEGAASAQSPGVTPAVPVATPAAPTGVSAVAGNGQVTVNWTAVTGATSYNVYRSTSAGSLGSKVGSISTTTYNDATAANGTTYYYAVTGSNAAGEGPASEPSAGATPAVPVTVPAAPTAVNAMAGNALVTVTWNASPTATSYKIYRSTNQGSQGTLIGSSSAPSYSDATVVNGSTYYYVVTAANSAGESAASTQSAPATPQVPLTAPPAPTGVNATAANAQVAVSWSTAARATSYNVYRSTTQGVQGAMIGSIASSATASYTDTTSVNGTTYYYTITAVNAAGESPASMQSSGATPTAPITVPAAPTGVNATDGIAQVTVAWTTATGATSYKVYRSTAQGQQGMLIGSTSAASLADSTALNGTTYYYAVTASSSAGESPASAAASVTPGTSWNTVKMGGGGYVPGVIYHPTVPHLRYARTDVAGVYRWDNAISSWTALTDGFGRPDGSYQGAESMAVDPTDPNRVYMTARMAVQFGNGRFYYSSDQGNTWNYVDLPFPVGSNNQGRAIGERLMVDPNLPSTLFYASRTAGLWKSTNRGLNWSQVTSLSSYVMTTAERDSANGGSPVGVEFVVFDVTVPTSGFTPTGSPTQTLYIGIAPDYKDLAGLTSYLYKSTNGGATWSAVSIPAGVINTIGASAVHIPHLARATDGVLYVPFTSGSGPGSGGPSSLYKFDGTTWTELITSGDGRYYGGIGGLSVYGAGATAKIAFGVSGTWGDAAWVQIAMRSADGGATWQEFGKSGDANGSLDYHTGSGYWGWVDDLDIDPFDPNHISYVVGGGIFSTTEGYSAALPHWTFDVAGIEEMINLAMAAPPPGAPYVLASGHGDTGLYVHTSLTASPTRSPNLGGGNGTGIDMAWNNPAFIVGVGTFTTSKGAYSTDAGVTWTNFPTVPPVANATGDESKVAVTADGANIIWAIRGQVPYYSTDRGASWTATNLPAPAVAYHLVADRKNPLKVYAYDTGGNWWYPSNSARLYYSTNGGHTFTASAQTWGPNGFNVTDLAVNPFVEGDVWLADANNLWHSVDSGLTWTKLTAMATVGAEFTNVHGAIKVALGAPAPGSGYSAALYLVGTINGKDAVYRSNDMGTTWVRIDDDAHRYGGVARIVADTNVYGRVFMAGRGIDYNN